MSEAAKQRESKSDYLRPSLPLPSQSSVLGFMRHLGLVQSGALSTDGRIADRDFAAEKVGSGSFLHKEVDEQHFGEIASIGPVCLFKNNVTMSPAGADVFEREQSPTVPNWEAIEGKFSDGVVSRDQLLLLQDYNAKTDYPQLFWQSNGQIEPASPHWIQPESRPALHRAETDDEKGLAQLHGHRIHEPGVGLRWFAELSGDLYALNGSAWQGVFPFGAEQALWTVTITPVEAVEPLTASVEASVPRGFHRIVLLSDAYLQQSNPDWLTAGVTSVTTFRNIRSRLRRDPNGNRTELTLNYAALNRTNGGDGSTPIRSGLHWLMGRGSAFLVHENHYDAFLAEMTTGPAAAFRQIGYNHFTTTKAQ